MRGPDVNSATRPQACPFVAFDDDRDRRSEAPDPRHRCFAVPNPEPRAIAHQQAYCLTPNFPSCAFFMDWAARAAAAPLAGSGAGFGAAPTAPSAYGAYGGQAPSQDALASADPGGRTWAAPPPWVDDPDLRATQPPPPAWSPAPQPVASPHVSVPTQPVAPAPPPAQSMAPARPEQLAALPDDEEPEVDRDYDLSGDARPVAVTSAPSAALPNRDPAILPVPAEAYPSAEDVRDAPQLVPLPPSRPERVDRSDYPDYTFPAAASVSPQPTDVPVPAPTYAPPPVATDGNRFPSGSTRFAPPEPEASSRPRPLGGSMPGDVDAGSEPPPEQRSRLTGRPVDAEGPSRFSPQARQPLKKRTDAEWSKPRRFEAYPTLSGRMRLGNFSPVLVGAFVIAIAALVLFLLPGFLGGGGGGRPNASRTPAASVATFAPTPVPSPTAASYTVKAGDTLGVVAKALGVTIEQIACFNNLKNVNALSVGQVLLVPPADYTCPVKPSPSKK